MSFKYNNSILVLTSPLSSVAALWCRGGGYKSYPMADAVIRASIQSLIEINVQEAPA